MTKNKLDKKMEDCNHSPENGFSMGSVGGMLGNDEIDRPPLVFTKCDKCNYAYVDFERPTFREIPEWVQESIR